MSTFKAAIFSTLLLLLSVTSSGCATAHGYKLLMQTWVGDDANNLIRKWGRPVDIVKLPNGNSIYVYSRSGSYTTPTYATTTVNTYNNSATANTAVYGGQTLVFSCETSFELGPDNRVVNVTWRGNNCVAVPKKY